MNEINTGQSRAPNINRHENFGYGLSNILCTIYIGYFKAVFPKESVNELNQIFTCSKQIVNSLRVAYLYNFRSVQTLYFKINLV